MLHTVQASLLHIPPHMPAGCRHLAATSAVRSVPRPRALRRASPHQQTERGHTTKVYARHTACCLVLLRLNSSLHLPPYAQHRSTWCLSVSVQLHSMSSSPHSSLPPPHSLGGAPPTPASTSLMLAGEQRMAPQLVTVTGSLTQGTDAQAHRSLLNIAHNARSPPSPPCRRPIIVHGLAVQGVHSDGIGTIQPTNPRVRANKALTRVQPTTQMSG